jgi:hypothetical protein
MLAHFAQHRVEVSVPVFSDQARGLGATRDVTEEEDDLNLVAWR